MKHDHEAAKIVFVHMPKAGGGAIQVPRGHAGDGSFCTDIFADRWLATAGTWKPTCRR